MKANFKKTLTAIAATAMFSASMLSITANADTYEKSRNFGGINEPEMSIVTQMPVYTKPMPTLTKPMPTYTKPIPTYTKPMPTLTKPMPTLTKPMPETWIDPCTDPIGPEKFDIDCIDKRFLEVDHYYMQSNIRTTTTKVNMAAVK